MADMAVIGTATLNVETKPKGFWIEEGDTVLNVKRIVSSDWPRRELAPFTELKVLKVDQRTNQRGIATLDVTTEDQDYVWRLWADEIEKVVYEDDQAEGTSDRDLLIEIRDLLIEIREAVTPKQYESRNA